MLVYFIFVVALAATDAIRNNNTISKDKRQVHQPTQNFIPSNHQSQIGGQQHYAPTNEQIAAISPNYYRYVQKLLQNQQQPQQLSDAPKENAPPNQHHQYHNPQPTNDKQFIYFNEPQIQYQQEVEQQPHAEPKVISEEEYLELVRRQNEENKNNTATLNYPQSKARQFKFQHKDYPRVNVPNEHPQSYLKSYVNPLGEFSLEKELAQLEKSNKAVYQNSERDTEQTSKQERYEFKPSLQFASYQPDQFLPPEYAQFNGLRPVSQKLIDNPYERDESVPQKPNNQPEYQFRYGTPTESPVKYYQEAIKTGPKNAFVQLPKHQYLAESDNGPQANEKPNQPKKISQTIYQKQHTTSPPAQQSQKSGLQKQPTKTGSAFTEKLPQFQSNNHNAPSQSAIFVSQSTGVQQKPQEVDNQQEIAQHHQQLQQQQYKRPQVQQYEQAQQYEQPQQLPRLPPNPNRPLTQEEFQSLVDAGYNVKAIPIAVPVPVSQEVFDQHHQQQQQLQQQQIQQQQQQQQRIQQQHQQYQHQQPYQQPTGAVRPQSIRPQPSNKHFVRYHHQPTTEGVLSSYLRPFLDQYNNFMGGKI